MSDGPRFGGTGTGPVAGDRTDPAGDGDGNDNDNDNDNDNGNGNGNGGVKVRDVTEVLLGFARALRHAGVAATPERVQSMLTAAAALDVTEPAGVYWAGRLTLCAEPDDIPTYDAAFTAYFQDKPPRTQQAPPAARSQVITPFGMNESPPSSPDRTEEPPTRQSQASVVELLRQRDDADGRGSGGRRGSAAVD